MGTSPLTRLNNSWAGGIDPIALENKNNLLTTHYGEDLSGVLRYMFDGNIVPLEIQDAVVTIRRHLHTLYKGQILSTQGGNSNLITITDIVNNHSHYSINFLNTNNTTETIEIELISDQLRGKYPVTEIIWKGNRYRSVPFHGDVRNHLHHQHGWYKDVYINPLLDAGLISPEDATIIHLFHQIHDVPEKTKGDKHVDDKGGQDAQEESVIIQNIILESGIPYTTNELDLIRHSFSVFEQPSNYFKCGERYNYMLDALRVYHTAASFYNKHHNLTRDIFRRQLPYFSDESKKVRITPVDGKPENIPLSKLPSSELFFRIHGQEIQEVLASDGYTDILPLRDQITNTYKL